MKAFTFALVARYPDGVSRPLTGGVGAPVAADDGSDEYVCAFSCPLIGGGGQFRSVYPEWAYSKAVSFVRFNMYGLAFEPVDAAGNRADLAVPLTDASGNPCFAPAHFLGRCLHNGVLVDFTAEVQSPEPADHGEWTCRTRCSLYDFDHPVRSVSPEHAYELAFAFLRNIIDPLGEGQLTDRTGAPLLIRAPVLLHGEDQA
ncbi:MAG: hypothetical protein VW600_07135 [Ferrovibrio sp.]